MDTRQTPAERAAAERAVKDDAARADAMKQSAAIHARDAKAGTATIEKEDRVVTTFRGKEIVTREEAEAILLQEKVDAAEAEVGDGAIWYLLTKILKPEQILNLMVQCRAAAARAEEVEYNFEGQPYRFAPKETFKDDDESARARAYRAHVAAGKVTPGASAKFTPEPVPADETDAQKKLRLERDRVRKASVVEAASVAADVPDVIPNKYILDQIVLWTQSSNRP